MRVHWTLLISAVLAAGACSTGGRTGGDDALDALPDADLPDAPPDAPPVFPETAPDEPGPRDLFPDLGADPGMPDGFEVWQPQPCKSHADCGDGYCVELVPGSAQFFCVPTCIDECPLDWVCKAVYLDGPDPVSICLPPGGPCAEQDLHQDGLDEDCDGLTDEDVYMGVTLWGWTFGSGRATSLGAGMVLSAKLSAPPYFAVSSGGDFVLVSGSGTHAEGQ